MSKKIKLSIVKAIQNTILILIILSLSGSSATPKESLSDIDLKVRAAFASLKAKRWHKAQDLFRQAVDLYDEKGGVSFKLISLLSAYGEIEASSRDIAKRQVSDEITGYYLSMTTEQSLYEFLCFAAQMNGDNKTADEYYNKTLSLRGFFWGQSWAKAVRMCHRLILSIVPPDKSENYGKLLLYSGFLMLEAGYDDEALKILRGSKAILTSNPQTPAKLSYYYITHGNPKAAKAMVQESLALSPDQASVLIDLSISNWLLGDIPAAKKTAHKAVAVDASLPGPHAILALVALEQNQIDVALEEAKKGNTLSNGHKFYKTLLAVVLWAKGDKLGATEIIKKDGIDIELMKKWFFKGKALDYLLKMQKNIGVN